jgi:hypothetical protein
MIIKYQELMKSSGIAIDNPGLDPAFVSKVNTFEQKLKDNQMTDEEITAGDDELVELFSKHEITEEDAPEVIAERKKAEVSEAKAAIAGSEDIKELGNMRGVYKEHPEVLALIDAKIKKITDATAKKKENEATQKAADARAKIIVDGTKEINMAKYEDLQAMGEKYKEYPELIKLVNERHEKEKPQKDDEELKKQLLSKSEWSYSALKAIGVKPTGDDMVVAGVKLEREYLLEIYSVRK